MVDNMTDRYKARLAINKLVSAISDGLSGAQFILPVEGLLPEEAEKDSSDQSFFIRIILDELETGKVFDYDEGVAQIRKNGHHMEFADLVVKAIKSMGIEIEDKGEAILEYNYHNIVRATTFGANSATIREFDIKEVRYDEGGEKNYKNVSVQRDESKEENGRSVFLGEAEEEPIICRTIEVSISDEMFVEKVENATRIMIPALQAAIKLKFGESLRTDIDLPEHQHHAPSSEDSRQMLKALAELLNVKMVVQGEGLGNRTHGGK